MKGIKVWLLTAVVLMTGGVALSAIGLSRGATWNMRFDLKNFKFVTGSEDYIDETVDVDEFNKLVLKTNTVDVNIIKGDKYSVSYHIPKDQKPDVSVNARTLVVSTEETEGFQLFNFGFFFDHDDNPYINITVPDSMDEKIIAVATSTGDVTISGLTIDGSVQTSTGDIKVSDTKMGDMTFQVSTGDITINKCTSESIETKASTGDVKITDSTCKGRYYSKTSTGDVFVSGSELGSFVLEGSTSDVDVNNTRIDNVKISTSTGDVSMNLRGNEKDYNLDIKTGTGDIEIGNAEYEDRYTRDTDGNNSIVITTSTGDVKIDFSKQ